jgi:hypothetical protein
MDMLHLRFRVQLSDSAESRKHALYISDVKLLIYKAVIKRIWIYGIEL